MTNRLMVLVSVAALFLGCDSASSSNRSPIDIDRDEAALRGTTVTNVVSTASELTTPDGIIGTVGALFVRGEFGTPVFWCTGTLVTRDLFLTAGHCVIDKNTGELKYGPMHVEFPQSYGTSYPVDKTGIHVHPLVAQYASMDRPFGSDIAIVPLLTPVPSDVVAKVAPVFTGNIQSEVFNRQDRLTSPIQVGMGINDQGRTGPRFRAWGRVQTLRPGTSPTGPALIANTDDESWADSGDSGGPVFMLYRGVYTMVGLTSGFDEGLEVKALLGSMQDRDSAAWLVPLLGDDADGDGVIDSADNCAPERCIETGRDIGECANGDQADDDGDGVGDVCDNCRATICDTLNARNPAQAAYFHCFNPDQENRDGDELGDACDLCPELPNGAELDDRDNDLVGDDCDPCIDQNPYQKCWVGSSDCLAGDCVGRPGSYGHCTAHPDDDNDTIPDSCDNCPGIQTRVITNSNALAESQYLDDEGNAVEALGDWCESVPLFRMSTPPSEVVQVAPPPQTTGENGVANVLEFGGDSWIGCDPNAGLDCDAHAPPANGNVLHEGGVTFGFCSCLDGGNPQPAVDCHDMCDASNWDRRTWKTITVLTPGGTPVTDDDPARQEFLERRGSEPASFKWRFYDDVTFRGIDSYSVEGETQVQGLLGSHVTSDSMLGGRDFDTDGRLRTSVALVRAPDYKVVMFEPAVEIEVCNTPNCLVWIHPEAMERINPAPYERLFEAIPDISILIRVEEQVYLNNVGAVAFDVTGQVDQDVTNLLGNAASFAYLHATEPDSLLATAGIESQVAIVPREDSGFTSPARIGMADGTLVVTQHAPELVLDNSMVTRLASVVVPSAGRAVYSAMQDRLYVAGGAAGTEPIGAIRIYDFATDAWAPLNADMPIGERVLGLALDSLRNHLYVLDVDERVGARLLDIDLVAGASTVQAEIPFADLYEKYALAVDTDGDVLVVASRLSEMKAWRCRMDLDTGTVEWLGMVESELAVVLDEPVFRGDDLVLPVARIGSYGFMSLGQAAFVQPAGPVSL